ncbi:hypothetical protein BDZ89DRAFT_1070465 [Hymenopellis radicata]|nr:hypothetical protein BDZ89DRAFT_1070465 [Hymenopellis radicata]
MKDRTDDEITPSSAPKNYHKLRPLRVDVDILPRQAFPRGCTRLTGSLASLEFVPKQNSAFR